MDKDIFTSCGHLQMEVFSDRSMTIEYKGDTRTVTKRAGRVREQSNNATTTGENLDQRKGDTTFSPTANSDPKCRARPKIISFQALEDLKMEPLMVLPNRERKIELLGSTQLGYFD